jgi:hypothetical protein
MSILMFIPDLISSASLNGFGKKVIALYVGRERRSYSAHLELAGLQKPQRIPPYVHFAP